MSRIIMPVGRGMATPKANVGLAKRAEEFEQKKIASYALVTVMSNGDVLVDFDLREMNTKNVAAIGSAVEQLYKHLAGMYHETVSREAASTPEQLRRVTGGIDEVARYAKDN